MPRKRLDAEHGADNERAQGNPNRSSNVAAVPIRLRTPDSSLYTITSHRICDFALHAGKALAIATTMFNLARLKDSDW